MTSADWPQIETSVSGLSSRSGISPDLFGGDLFSDELMDLYNSSSYVGPGGSDMNESNADTPTVLPNTTGYDSSDKATSNNCYSAQGNPRLRTLDDGLGAFRPSTSFNDFAALLNSPDASASISVAANVSKRTISSTTTPLPVISDVSGNASPVKDLSTFKPKKRSRADHKSSEGGALPSKKMTFNNLSALTKATANANAQSPDTLQLSFVVASASAPSIEAVEQKQQQPINDISEAQDINNNISTLSEGLRLRSRSMLKKQEGSDGAQATKDALNSLDLSVPENRCAITDFALSAHVGSVVTSPTNTNTDAVPNATGLLLPPPIISSTAILPTGSPKTTADSTQHCRSDAALLAAVAAAPSSETASVPLSAQSHFADAAAAVAPSSPSSFVPSEPATEESFKELARVAVTNLILKAGGAAVKLDPMDMNDVTDDDSDCCGYCKGPVNTSTDHVAALTSNNWVAACSASVSGAPPGTAAAAQAAALAAANDPTASKAARARRATLSPDEKARQNRDRNREHARNTRLRKKAYVEELKRTLTELVSLRDAADLERRHEVQRDLEVREVRFRVMEEFLKLRARGGEPGLLTRWVAILEDGFTLTLPKTEYRTMGGSFRQDTNGRFPFEVTRSVSVDNATTVAANRGQTVGPFEHVLRGVSESMDDAARLSAFVNSLGDGNNGKNVVHMTHYCEKKSFLMDSVNTVLEYRLTTTGVLNKGTTSEFMIKGSMRATFSPESNKLARAELLFDTGSITSQLKSLISQAPVPNDWHVLSPLSKSEMGVAAATADAAEGNASVDTFCVSQIGTTHKSDIKNKEVSLDNSTPV